MNKKITNLPHTKDNLTNMVKVYDNEYDHYVTFMNNAYTKSQLHIQEIMMNFDFNSC